MKSLLIETSLIRVDRSLLIESAKKNDGRLIVRNMKIQQADAPNKNKRVYPRSIMEREMTKLMEGKKSSGSRGIIGELDHPSTGQSSDSVISLKNACLGVIDWHWNGQDVLGDVEIFKDMTSDKSGFGTPSGEILGNLILAGYTVGISSRGLGSVEMMTESDDEIVEVQDDFELITYDGVSDPSSHNAFFKSIHESVGRNYTSDKYTRANELIRGILCDISGVCCLK